MFSISIFLGCGWMVMAWHGAALQEKEEVATRQAPAAAHSQRGNRSKAASEEAARPTSLGRKHHACTAKRPLLGSEPSDWLGRCSGSDNLALANCAWNLSLAPTPPSAQPPTTVTHRNSQRLCHKQTHHRLHTLPCLPHPRPLSAHPCLPGSLTRILGDISHCPRSALAWTKARYMEANHGARSSGGPDATVNTSSVMADDNGRTSAPLQPAVTAVELPDPLSHALTPFNVAMPGAALPFASATSVTLPPFDMELPALAAPAAFPAFLPYHHPGLATSTRHPQTHPPAMPCDPGSWEFLGRDSAPLPANARRHATLPRQAANTCPTHHAVSPSPWPSVGSTANIGHDVGDSEALSQHLYAPSLAPAGAASLPSALVSGTDDARLGNDPGTAESVGDDEMRLAVPPPPPHRHGGAAPHPMHLVGPTVDDDIPFSTDLLSFDMSAYSGPDHSEPPASIGPEPLQPSPEPLPDPGWASDHAWRPAYSSSFTDPSACPPVGRPHSPPGNAMAYESPHPAQSTRINVVPTRPQEAIASSSGVDSLRGSRVRAAPSGPSRRSHSRQEMKPYMSRFATSSTKRKSFSPIRRREVAITRKIGACFICKLQKGTVGVFTQSCLSLASTDGRRIIVCTSAPC